MNAQTIIPLIAALAYIPCLIILLDNRPWQLRQRLFFLLLISAMLWSIADIFFRSDFFLEYKLPLVRIVLCLAIWMIIQFRYLGQSFYKSDVAKKPYAYIILVIAIVLVAVSKMPQSMEVIVNGQPPIDYLDWLQNTPISPVDSFHVKYGILMLLLASSVLIIGIKDIYHLAQKLRVSANAVERNQIIYFFVSLACLAILGFSTLLITSAGTYPVAHIGNLLSAIVLTYAVVAHRLLDVRIVFRRALMYISLYGGGLLIILLIFHLVDTLSLFDPDLTTLLVAIGMGIPIVAFLTHSVRDFLQAKLEKAFIGERYSYRKKLSEFTARIHGIPTINELGDEFVSLIAQSLDCHKSCLLLPEAETGIFNTRFFYPPVEDNPISKLKFMQNSPVVNWLKREKIMLQKESLAILPEFRSMWKEEKEEIKQAGIEVFVPLMNRGELVAVLAVGERRSGKFYAVEDIDLLESIAAQVAASMEKEYFHEQLREQDKEITLINRLTTIITSNVSIHEIFDGFAQELKEVADVDWAAIGIIDGDDLCISALSGNIESPWQIGERIPLKDTGTEWVCREGKSLYEADLARYHRFWTGEHYLHQGLHSVVYLPLTIKEKDIGSLILGSLKPNAYSQRQIKLLEQVALQISTPIENSQLYAQAEQRARIDELTGLYNRRHFEERLKEEIDRHSRYGDAFSVLLLDLDNFKTYNDIYGHPAGDVLLSEIGRIIKISVRGADQAFRYGGDEFAVILPQAVMDDAYVVAERVRLQIIREMEVKEIAVTCSIGVASYPTDGVISGELVTVADTALYYAKRTGGNRVYLSSKILSEPVEEAGTYARHNGLSAIYALVSTVEAKDPHTYGHSKKVNTYAVALAEAVGLSPEDVSRVSTAALLHDIGKIGIPDKVLNKKSKLNDEDWEAIRAHPKLGANIVGNVPNLAPCVSIILHHHERWDGSGYPEGLKGEQISIEARILAIADAFEAMTAARPYRPALCSPKVLKELHRGAGTQFDPELIKVFIGIVEPELNEEVKTGQDSANKQ